MRHPPLPRWLPILLLLVLAGTFLTGTLQAFASVQITPTATYTPDQAQPSPTPGAATPPAPAYAVGNTNGIISLALLVVAIVVIGAAWGLRKPRPGSGKK